jgi:tyrosinase
MVDKIWYDWQCRDPVNVNSFFGGSVEYIGNLTGYDQYPNGGPPYLSVSALPILVRDSS